MATHDIDRLPSGVSWYYTPEDYQGWFEKLGTRLAHHARVGETEYLTSRIVTGTALVYYRVERPSAESVKVTRIDRIAYIVSCDPVALAQLLQS